jgi:hypothetical protein
MSSKKSSTRTEQPSSTDRVLSRDSAIASSSDRHANEHVKFTTPPRYQLQRVAAGWQVINDSSSVLASYPTLDQAIERTKALLEVHPLYELDRIWGVSPNKFTILCRLRPEPSAKS